MHAENPNLNKKKLSIVTNARKKFPKWIISHTVAINSFFFIVIVIHIYLLFFLRDNV